MKQKEQTREQMYNASIEACVQSATVTIYELEAKISYLLKSNDTLKIQLQELRKALVANQQGK